MVITEIRLNKVSSNSRVKAVASVVFDNCFAVTDIKVIESNNGLFVAMPSRKSNDGSSFQDIAHPVNSDMRKYINDSILSEYNKQV